MLWLWRLLLGLSNASTTQAGKHPPYPFLMLLWSETMNLDGDQDFKAWKWLSWNILFLCIYFAGGFGGKIGHAHSYCIP